MEPVVYDFAINERGTYANLLTGHNALMPSKYYTLTVPALLRLELRSLSASQRSVGVRGDFAVDTLQQTNAYILAIHISLPLVRVALTCSVPGAVYTKSTRRKAATRTRKPL